MGPSDTLFIELAIAKGYLDRAHAEEALSVQSATAQDGAGRRLLAQILEEEGWMTAEQVREVSSQIEEGGIRTGRIEGYRLLAKVGQGGMATIYKAVREVTGETVALKVLPRRMAQKTDFIERFLRESRAATRIVSEHIVRTLDVGFSGGYFYFAMEFVDGESVDTTLSIDGVIGEAKALRIVHQIAQALRDEESAKMLHRDIKPGNILVSKEGVAKLTDFGLARDIREESVTQTGMTLGTPNYMSPEQTLARKALDIRSDIYSLGATFYHMVTGSVPFRGETSIETMVKHLGEPLVPPRERRPELSEVCNAVILKMLEKNRDDRYGTARELIEDLELVMAGQAPKHAQVASARALRHEAEPAPPPTRARRLAGLRSRQSWVLWIEIGTVLFLAAIAGLVVYGLLAPEKEPGAERGGQRPLTAADRAAESALDDAKRFAEKNPAELAAIAHRLAAVKREYEKTAAGAEADRLAGEARSRLAAATGQALAECDKAAAALMAQDRFGEAEQAYEKFPQPLRTPETAERLESARQDVAKRASGRFLALKRQAEDLMNKGQWAEARKLIEPARLFGVRDVEEEAGKLLERIDAAGGATVP